jgi:hypothetical protein
VEQELLTFLELFTFILCSNTSVNESYHDRFIYLDKNNNPIIEQPYKMIYMLQCILGYTSNLAVMAFLIIQISDMSQVTDKLCHIMCIEYTSSERDSKSKLQW